MLRCVPLRGSKGHDGGGNVLEISLESKQVNHSSRRNKNPRHSLLNTKETAERRGLE